MSNGLPPLDIIVAEQCRRSFHRFFLEFWETIEAVELVPNWHIEYLCGQLQEVFETWARKDAQPDVLINVPPGTSKSTTVTQLFPAWLWLKAPATRIISSSYASSLSVSHGIKTRDCLRSDKFNRLFPGLIEAKDDEDGKTAYRNTKGGQRYTTSTGGAVTGVHADFIIIDDPLKPDEATSEAGLASADKNLKTLATRKTDKARSVTIMVMQRLSEKDPAGLWLGSGKVLRHICLPGELKPDSKGVVGAQVRPVELLTRYTDGLLDPRRLGRAVLAGLAISLGSYGYAGQVQQLPAPEEGGILKKAWFKNMSWAHFLETVVGAKNAVWLFDADTAYTDNQKNDPTAFLSSVYLGQTLYVRAALEMWLALPQLKAKLVELLPLHGYRVPLSKLHVEPKASGKDVVAELRNMSQVNVVEAPTPVADKTARVNAASPFIESGRVCLILDAPGAPAGWVEAFINQAAGFPTAAHDDMLDTLTQAIARYNKKQGGGTTWS
ncbi:MAG: phage terminase large subunit [Janthinobacterium lividum]